MKTRLHLGGYREYTPPDDLRIFVQGVWTYSRPIDGAPIPGLGHRLVPDPALSLTFSSRRDAAGNVLSGRLVLIGPTTTQRFFSPEAGVDAAAVRLHPEWARDILGVDPRDHFDSVEAAAGTFPAKGRRAFDRLARTQSATEAIEVLLDEMRSLIATARISRESRLAHAAREWIASRNASTLSLHELARENGVSERHLRRAVKTTTGASPKQLHRIRRVLEVMLTADRVARPAWAQLAADNGFYDQPHMIAEFQAMAGCSPAQLHTERSAQI